MPVQNVSIEITDRGLGFTQAVNPKAFCLYGVCSLGIVGHIYNLSNTDDVKTQLGVGPLAEAYAMMIALTGGGHVAVPVTSDVSATETTVTATRVATSTGVMTTTGNATNTFNIIAKVVSTGTGQVISGGLVALQISIDGGNNFGPRTLIPSGTGQVVATTPATSSKTGLTLAFTMTGADNYDYGDIFTLSTVAPFYGSTNLGLAITASVADNTPWNLAYAVGLPNSGVIATDATASYNIAVGAGTGMDSAFAVERDARIIVETPQASSGSDDTALETAFANFGHTRVVVNAGGLDQMISSIDGRVMKHGHALAEAVRLAQIEPKRSPGVDADGSLSSVVSIGRDERQRPALFDQRFAVARTIIGVPGFFNDIGNMMAPVGSDYSLVMHGRIIDLVSQACRAAGHFFSNQTLFVNTKGQLDPKEAVRINGYFASRIAQLAGGQYNDLRIAANTTDIITTTNKLRVLVRVQPFPYAQYVDINIGLVASF